MQASRDDESSRSTKYAFVFIGGALDSLLGWSLASLLGGFTTFSSYELDTVTAYNVRVCCIAFQ